MTTRRQTSGRLNDVYRRRRQCKASRSRREVSRRSGRAVERALGTVGVLLMAVMAWPSCPGPVHGQEVSQREATGALSFEQWAREVTNLFDVSVEVDVIATLRTISQAKVMQLDSSQKRLATVLLCQLLTRQEQLRDRDHWLSWGMSPLAHVHREACDALVQLGDVAAIPHLRRLYLQLGGKGGRDPSFHVERVIRALDGEVPVIERSPQERQWPPDSVLSMDELKGARAELILQHLQEEGWDNTELRTKSAQAIYELGELRAREAVPYLLEQLGQDVPYTMRREAVSALGKIDDARAVEPLRDFLRQDGAPGHPHASSYLRRQAIDALVHMKAEAALPDIKRCLDDPEPTVRSAAFVAVCDLGEPGDRAAAVEKLRNDPDPEVRRTVERALGQ
jgi:HEAT repeat protein